ncbi:MAG: L-threonylcarbamoyladenylate synthase [Eggerthellaceae bacterium]|jgi:L-threonylcarbamoyladenylate synthase
MALQASTFNETTEALRAGKPAIFPTETVYGLGVAVEMAPSPEIIYELKERPHRKPISWLIASVDDLDRYGKDIPSYARILAETFWPGPLTLIVKAADRVPQAYQAQGGTIGLRMPNNHMALQLIEAVGCPLATTSANRSGYLAPSSFSGLDEVLVTSCGTALRDGTDADKSGVASTVIDCTNPQPKILREGVVTEAYIRALSE